MRGILAGCILALLAACPALAELAEPDRHIGRLNHAGYDNYSHCTGFVVEGGHLVTAKHCLPRAERSVHYLSAYDRGDFRKHVEEPLSSFHVVPGHDIAILCNAVADGKGRPLSRHRPAAADWVTIWGYPAPRSQVFQVKSCDVIDSTERAIDIGCPLAPGNSGGPVTMRINGVSSVVGVVSATGPAASVAYRLRPDMLSVCK